MHLIPSLQTGTQGWNGCVGDRKLLSLTGLPHCSSITLDLFGDFGWGLTVQSVRWGITQILHDTATA